DLDLLGELAGDEDGWLTLDVIWLVIQLGHAALCPSHPGIGGRLILIAEKDFKGLVQVAERGGDTPGADRWIPFAEPGQAELGVYAALRAEQLVPFIDDDCFQITKVTIGVGVGKQQRKTFGRCDEAGWQAIALALSRCLGGVARTTI